MKNLDCFGLLLMRLFGLSTPGMILIREKLDASKKQKEVVHLRRSFSSQVHIF